MVTSGKIILFCAFLLYHFISEGRHKIACMKIEESTNGGMASLETMYVSYRTLFATLFSFLSEGHQTIQMKERNQLMMPVLCKR